MPQFILEVLCAGDEKVSYKQIHFCMHGVGHAFGYKDIFFPISKTNYSCLPSPEPEVHDAKLSFDAAHYCNTVRPPRHSPSAQAVPRAGLCCTRGALCGRSAERWSLRAPRLWPHITAAEAAAHPGCSRSTPPL